MTTRSVHLVGSFPFDSTREVFDLCGASLSGLMRRIPDGEPGVRSQWINWQHTEVLPRTEQLEIGGQGQIPNLPPFPTYRIKAGYKAADVRFPALGYANAAIESHRLLKEYQSRGKLDAGLRLQVSLPTPFVVAFAYFVPEAFAAIWPRYEAAMFGEIDAMLRVIPAKELAIQWDIAAEVTVLETPPLREVYPRAALVEALIRAVDRIPAPTEVGLHLCYGDPGGKHVVEPKDLSLLVALANEVGAGARRPIAWLHMPVPRLRTDLAYFRSLSDLQRGRDTELHLGLVHHADGVAGGLRRMQAARAFVEDFGIATECGLGRRSKQQIADIIAIHAQLARS
jgi:hypothetical protein